MIKTATIYNRYITIWKRLEGRKLFLFYVLHYTILFMALYGFIYYKDFYSSGRSFILGGDGVTQHFAYAMVRVSKVVRDGIQSLLNGAGWTMPLYDFSTGASLLTLQGIDTFWPSIFVPWDKQDIFYNLAVVMLYWLVGLTFSVLGFYYKQRPLPIMIGAFSYTFCSYFLWVGIRHPYFAVPSFIYFPVLIVGSEKVLRKENPSLLVAAVFLSFMHGVLFAYIATTLTALFVIIRFFSIYNENRVINFFISIGRITIWAGLGVLLAGIVWVPAFLQLLDSTRVGRDVSQYTNLMVHTKLIYEKILAFFTVNPSGIIGYGHLGFSTLAIPCVSLLFIAKKKQWNTLRIMFLLFTIMFCIPWVSYVLSGFNDIISRWCYAYALCVAIIIMVVLPYFADIDRFTFIKVCFVALSYFVICRLWLNKDLYREEVFVILGVGILTIALFRLAGKNAVRYILPSMMVVTFVSICFSAHLLYSKNERGYSSDFISRGQAYQRLEEGQYYSLGKSNKIKSDNTFYYVAGSSISNAEVNAAFYSGVNGLSFYTPSDVSSNDWRKWCRELELGMTGSTNLFFGLANRSPMLTLSNVKYYAVREGDRGTIPYGFEEIDRVKNGSNVDIILENKCFLPVGYTYDQYMHRNDYEKLNALEKQEMQLQAVVLEKSPNSDQIELATITHNTQQVAATVTEAKGLTWENATADVKEKNATLTIRFKGIPKAETYLRIVGLDLTSGASTRNWLIKASTENVLTSARFTADADRLSNKMKTQLLNLGYSENGYTNCTIVFPATGVFKLENIEVWCQSMENYEHQINTLRKNVLEQVKTNWRGLTGTISVSNDKILCFAVPYSNGWSAYIDSNRVPLLRANTGFIAVELTTGQHEVELRYWMPGLTAGVVLTCAAVGIITILFIYNRKKSYRTIFKLL